MNQKTLTVKQALEQGYESYFYNSDGWQGMKYISDILIEPDSIDWKRDDIFISEKQARQTMSLSEGELKDIIIDQLEGTYYDLTSDDDSSVINDAFSDFDFKTLEDAINKVLEGVTTYHSTDIKLIP